MLKPAACRFACTFCASVANGTPLIVRSLGYSSVTFWLADAGRGERRLRLRQVLLDRGRLRQRAEEHRRDDPRRLDRARARRPPTIDL